MATAVFCLVPSETVANRIVDRLKSVGIAPNDVSALFPDKSGTREFAHEKNTKMPEGATTGVGVGGLLGGGLGWLVGTGALAIPGLGPFVAAGPILAALSGAAGGAAVGGLTGALIGMGIPEFEAKQYQGRVQQGDILMSVHTNNHEQVNQVKAIFKECGAEQIATAKEEAHA